MRAKQKSTVLEPDSRQKNRHNSNMSKITDSMLITKNGLPDSTGILATDIQETASQIFMTNKKQTIIIAKFYRKIIRKNASIFI